jgi:hypothetical protein
MNRKNSEGVSTIRQAQIIVRTNEGEFLRRNRGKQAFKPYLIVCMRSFSM